MVSALLIIAMAQTVVFADRPGWRKEQTNWRLTGGERIKAVSYPEGNTPPTLKKRQPHKPQRKLISRQDVKRTSIKTSSVVGGSIFANLIDSPPIDGFVPWIAVAATNARSDVGELDAVTQYSITGHDLNSTPQSSYAIGIYDTGASAHVMGNGAATRMGLFSSGLVTSNTAIVSGVTGDTEVWISEPIGIFVDGLGEIEPNGMLLHRSGMMGQSNVAIAVGEGGAPVDLPTAIGSPLSVYFTVAFNNDDPVTVTRDGNDYTAPGIHIYQQDDPCIPSYANTIPLELRPLGGTTVEYLFDFFDLEFEPTSPSVIIGNVSQSIFFVASVDLYKGRYSAIDKTRFLFDTGAQITVIGSRVASRLHLNPHTPDFEVEIQGVTGDTIMAPGFYLDTIDIPALGDWLSCSNVPVVLLDIPSPEGGTADGVIGMNLFTDLNFVFRGGGLFLQDDPAVDYEPITLAGDIASTGGDGTVDYLDLEALAYAWLATPESPNWNAQADIVSDSIINFYDFAILAQDWLRHTRISAVGDYHRVYFAYR